MDQAAISLKPNVLIAPLDWGLGHATRCIPVIRQLIQNNCNVLVAAEGPIKSLLHTEFPALSFIDLRGYHIRYSRNRWSLPWHIGRQIPKILSTIQYENERVRVIVDQQEIHGIISDNRFGFYHERVPSVFITHQLRIRTGLGSRADDVLQRLNYRYINQFHECWVPDNEEGFSLAGALAHPARMPQVPVRYIGPLSRLERPNGEPPQHVLVLLSGPEPQRSLLEDLLIRQLEGYSGPVVLVRGLPGETQPLKVPANVSVFNHLPAELLNDKMKQASIIISRCGYSTVMDLALLGKKSILIPTPGQAEQEYLARHLMKHRFALCVGQNVFRWKNALDLADSFDYRLDNLPLENQLPQAVESLVHTMKTSAL